MNRRVSRTDLDFEQALRAEGTVVLKESLDVDTLGVLDTSNTSLGSSLSPFASPEPLSKTTQPATPTVVPPTPSPSSSRAAVPSSSSSLAPSRDSSSSYSSREIFYDAQEDTDLQTKRRSMYRSPGSASSPDLATLLRKSKNKENASGRPSNVGTSTTALVPNRLVPTESRDASTSSSSRDRQRSVTSTVTVGSSGSPQGTPSTKPKLKLGMGSSSGSDYVLTSPRSMASMRDGGISKVGCAPEGETAHADTHPAQPSKSVRAKTTAFLGKMLGASSTRERSVRLPCHGDPVRVLTNPQRTVMSSPSVPYTAPAVFDAFPPPVPPLPKEHRGGSGRSIDTDVFTSPSSSMDLQKPLPDIMPDANDTDSDTEIEDTVDHSMVIVPSRARSPSPTGTVTHDTVKSGTVLAKRNKRRSMSVSDVDLKRVMSASSSSSPLPRASISSRESEGSDWNSIMTDFKGELLQLEPISAALLDLKDPSTPARRRPLSVRSQSDNVLASHSHEDRPAPKHSATEPHLSGAPTLTLQQPSLEHMNGSPLRTRSGSASNAISPRAPGLRFGPRSPVRSAVTSLTYIPSPSRDADRLRVQHRSTASSSEPSLVPIRDEKRNCM